MTLSLRALCTLSQIETELSVTPDSDTVRIERLIEAATRAIERYCSRSQGFHHESARVDVLRGFGTVSIHAPKTPLLSIGSIVFDPDDANSTVTASLYSLDNSEQGRIYRESRWQSTADVQGLMVGSFLPGTEQSLYQVTYAAGYITSRQTADDGPFPPATVTITRSGTTATVTHTAHGLLTGNFVTVTGAGEGDYNVALSEITKVDDDTYTYQVSGSPATPATGTITATIQPTLPADIEDACIMLVSMRYRWTPRDPSVKSEKIKSWGASYDTGAASSGAMDASTQAGALDAYKKLVFA